MLSIDSLLIQLMNFFNCGHIWEDQVPRPDACEATWWHGTWRTGPHCLVGYPRKRKSAALCPPPPQPGPAFCATIKTQFMNYFYEIYNPIAFGVLC